jgi:hypothetical protein
MSIGQTRAPLQPITNGCAEAVREVRLVTGQPEKHARNSFVNSADATPRELSVVSKSEAVDHPATSQAT